MKNAIYLPLFLWLVSSTSCSRRIHQSVGEDSSLMRHERLVAEFDDSLLVNRRRQIVVENPCLIVRRIRNGDTITAYAVAGRMMIADSLAVAEIASRTLSTDDSLSVRTDRKVCNDITTSSVPLWLKLAFAAVVILSILTLTGIGFRR